MNLRIFRGILVIFVAVQMKKARSEEYDTSKIFTNNLSLCDGVADKVFLPYIGDCKKYYLCWDGKDYEKKCDDGYYFNAYNQSCSRKSDNCPPKCELNKLTTFSYSRTCNKYVLCYYEIPVLRTCHDNLQYNPKTDRCDFAQYVDCVDNECSRFDEANELSYLPSKASCDKYYLCAKGVPVSYTCTAGLHFSTKCNCCDYPEKSNCQITAINRNIQPFSRTPLKKVDSLCPASGVHFLAHNQRRDAYNYCVDGHGITLDCTPGLWYDAKVQECREPKYIEE
ncbi:protein obstructor-E [Drosophila nasuta]|uniref:protein obstructor-E n=1 Tax=Drosophila nasuta TaxID=42062 RepID=UPI00295E9E5F|nr:protein obstructor-E [Drosophila nasuta]